MTGTLYDGPEQVGYDPPVLTDCTPPDDTCGDLGDLWHTK